jgi:hypothetical protein
MSSWCEVAEVEQHLGKVEGPNYTAEDMAIRIERATTIVKADLAGILTVTLLDAWDADVTVIPPVIRMATASLAAAHVLQDFAQFQSTSDRQSKAGGLYLSYQNVKDAIIKNKNVIITSDKNNAALATSAAVIHSSTMGKTPVFSIGDSTTTGTLDNF